jgi:hypothetical protein
MSPENNDPENQSPPETPPETLTETADKELAEGFAFALFCFEHRDANSEISDDEIRDFWQKGPEERKTARRRAAGFAQLLEVSGLGVKSSSRATLRKRLEYAIITPPREAYSADE